MSMRHISTAAAAVALSIVLVHTAGAAEADYPRKELLIEPAELAKPESGTKRVILDARSQADYSRGHVPQARRVDHDAWKSAFGDGKDAADWSRRIGELGIARDTEVVIYDDAMSKDAARVWWILRYWGHPRARLLNGGWKGWTAGDFPVTAEAPAPAEPARFNARPRATLLVQKDQLVSLLAERKAQIVDARSEGEFCGEVTLGNKRGGAMPDARHLEWSALIDKQTHRFKPADDLQRLFAEAHVDLTKPTATHCQSGGRSSVMAFALELMGASEVRNYYNGWSEWGNADDTPIVIPDKKPAGK